MIGMAIAQRLSGRQPAGRDAHARHVRRVVSRVHRLQPGLQEHPGVLDGDAGRAAVAAHVERRPTIQRTCAATGALREPVARRHVAPARRGRVRRDGVAGRCSSTRRSTRRRCSTGATSRAAIRSRGAARRRRTRTSIPQAQRDPVAAVEMLRRLAFSGVRVSQLTAPVDAERRGVPGRHVGHSDRSGIRGARARGARRAEVSGDSRVAGRPARSAVRRGGLDAAAVDGRATVTTAADPLSADVRSKMKLLGSLPERRQPKPTPYNMTTSAGRRAVRQRARHRLRLELVARPRSCRRPGRSRARARRSRSIPRENNTFRAHQPRVEAGARRGRPVREPASARYVITGLCRERRTSW